MYCNGIPVCMYIKKLCNLCFFNLGSNYANHVSQMAPAVTELSKLESLAQLSFLKRHYKSA